LARKVECREPIREPGWTCEEYVRTGMSKGDIVMRVIFDTICNDMIILHADAVRLGLTGKRRAAMANL
jgi:hypothetical protein